MHNPHRQADRDAIDRTVFLPRQYDILWQLNPAGCRIGNPADQSLTRSIDITIRSDRMGSKKEKY